MVLAESTILEDLGTGKVERQRRYFKAKVLEDHKADGTNDTLKRSIDDEQTIVFTGQSTSYVDIADYAELHITEK
jgi:recombination DNA repair RAD52 pathway protein